MGVAGATIAAAGISAGAGLLGSSMQSSAVSDASNKATEAELSMYNQTRSDLDPYRTAGYSSIAQQQNLLGLNGQAAADAAMSTYQTSPGYQWQVSEGLRGVDAGAAAKGMLRSGATLKAEQTRGQELANTDFTNYYNRLSGLTTTGANAAAGQATANTTTGAEVATTATNEGTALSSIYGNTTSGLSNTINSLFSNPDVKSWLTGSSSSSQYGGLNNASPTVNYGGTTYGTGGQSWPAF